MSEFRNGLRGTLACACYTLRLRLNLGYPRQLTGLRMGMCSRATDLVQVHILLLHPAMEFEIKYDF